MDTNQYANDNGLGANAPARLPVKPLVIESPSRRRWWILLAVPLIAGAASVSLARAHGPGGGPFGGSGGGRMGALMQERMEGLLTAAGASDAQKTQVKAVWTPLQPQLRTLHEQERNLRHQIGEAVAAATIDTKRIEQLRQQSVQTMDKLSAVMTQGLVASAQVLTPEQRKLVLAKMEEHRARGPRGRD